MSIVNIFSILIQDYIVAHKPLIPLIKNCAAIAPTISPIIKNNFALFNNRLVAIPYYRNTILSARYSYSLCI